MFKKISNLIFEALHLKRIKHEGIRFAGIREPDSIAEHSLLASQIGYLLAKIENADSGKVVKMLIWHDMPEARIGDLHKISSRYLSGKYEAEKEVLNDQFHGFPFEDEIKDLFEDYENGITLEGKIAKDADLLEQVFQCREYLETGYIHAQDWIDNVGKSLKTASAKELFKEASKMGFCDWWKNNNLKKL